MALSDPHTAPSEARSPPLRSSFAMWHTGGPMSRWSSAGQPMPRPEQSDCLQPNLRLLGQTSLARIRHGQAPARVPSPIAVRNPKGEAFSSHPSLARLAPGPWSESATETRSERPICKMIGSYRSRAPPLPSRPDNRTVSVKPRPSPIPRSHTQLVWGHLRRWPPHPSLLPSGPLGQFDVRTGVASLRPSDEGWPP